MSQFVSSRIVIPENFCSIDNRIYGIADMNNLRGTKLILYIDSLSCGPCRIAHFLDLLPLYDFASSDGRFSVVTIFSPSINDFRLSLSDIHRYL